MGNDGYVPVNGLWWLRVSPMRAGSTISNTGSALDRKLVALSFLYSRCCHEHRLSQRLMNSKTTLAYSPVWGQYFFSFIQRRTGCQNLYHCTSTERLWMPRIVNFVNVLSFDSICGWFLLCQFEWSFSSCNIGTIAYNTFIIWLSLERVMMRSRMMIDAMRSIFSRSFSPNKSQVLAICCRMTNQSKESINHSNEGIFPSRTNQFGNKNIPLLTRSTYCIELLSWIWDSFLRRGVVPTLFYCTAHSRCTGTRTYYSMSTFSSKDIVHAPPARR